MIAVVGTGSWGAATAAAIARQGRERVLLFGRDPDKVAGMLRTRSHPELGTFVLPEAVVPCAEPDRLREAELLLWAVPTQHSRAQAQRLVGHLPAGVPVVSLSKGLEQGTLHRVSEILEGQLGTRPYGAISGPCIAHEVAVGMPVGVVAAGPDGLCRDLVERLHAPRFRIYTSTDLAGVELAGALKNVVAVAAGICDGLGFGDNTKAALITRGLAEMRRLGRALGAADPTFAGLAGIGDLLATCYSPRGRNRALGLAIAKGEKPLEWLHRQSTVAEGAWTCRAAVALGTLKQVELPIAVQVTAIIWDGVPVRTAMEALLARAPKEEDA